MDFCEEVLWRCNQGNFQNPILHYDINIVKEFI